MVSFIMSCGGMRAHPGERTTAPALSLMKRKAASLRAADAAPYLSATA